VMLIRQRVEQGVSADRDLNRALGEAEGVKASLAPLRVAIAGQINRLDVLRGVQAGNGRAELSSPAPIPAALVPSGSANPAELMRRRPDVVAAERRVAAANARIGVAVSSYYPKLSLTGLLGLASAGTSSFFTGGAVQASGGLGLRWRLFDFGRIDAEVAGARGHDAEVIALYRSSVLRATEDVENAFVQLSEGRQEVAALERQVLALGRARARVRCSTCWMQTGPCSGRRMGWSRRARKRRGRRSQRSGPWAADMRRFEPWQTKARIRLERGRVSSMRRLAQSA
jgi:outer membrane protein TolC